MLVLMWVFVDVWDFAAFTFAGIGVRYLRSIRLGKSLPLRCVSGWACVSVRSVNYSLRRIKPVMSLDLLTTGIRRFIYESSHT